MNLFETLKKKQRKTPWNKSDEMSFFLDNCGMLSAYRIYAPYAKATKPFDVIRANIIIRSLLNKKTIENSYLKSYKTIKKSGATQPEIEAEDKANEFLEKLPYAEIKGKRIYVPTLSEGINEIYGQKMRMLLEKNYASLLDEFEELCIDPFDVYGNRLYCSYFTKLLLIKEHGDISAYYDYDSRSIYMINERGRLDGQIALFDRGIRFPNMEHMMDRIVPVVDAYFACDKEKLKKVLVENKLISSKLIDRNTFDDIRLFSKLEKN